MSDDERSDIPVEPCYYKPGEIGHVLADAELWLDRAAKTLVWDGCYRQVHQLAEGLVTALLAVAALADVVVKATDYGTQDGDFVAAYLLPTGPIHRAIPLLEQRFGIMVRPGFDGRLANQADKAGEHDRS